MQPSKRLEAKPKPAQSKPISQPVSNINTPEPTPDVTLALSEPRAFRLTPQVVQSLQRTHGNRYVQRLIEQSKQSEQPNLARPVAVTRVSPPKVQRALYLWSVQQFKTQKEQASNRKKLGFKHSKDYAKLHNNYDKAVGAGKLDDAFNVLKQISDKLGRMHDKKYWLPDKKDAFFSSFLHSYNQELVWLETQRRQLEEANAMAQISTAVIEAYEELGVHHVAPDYKEFLMLTAEQAHKKDRDRQYAQMINEALVKAMSADPRAKAVVSKKAFINELVETLYTQDRITFVDVMNTIATMLPRHGVVGSTIQTKTMQQAIDAVVNGSLSPEDKIVEVARLLWGSFDWYVRKEGEVDKGDHFIRWLTNDTAPEPSGTNRMNCWEGAIFVLYKAGRVSKSTLKAAYKNVSNPGVGVAYRLIRANNAVTMWENGNYTGRHPNKGDIIHMWTEGDTNEPHHVVLALGQDSKGNDQVMSLWTGATGSIMGKTTVQKLIDGGHFERVNFSTPTFGIG